MKAYLKKPDPTPPPPPDIVVLEMSREEASALNYFISSYWKENCFRAKMIQNVHDTIAYATHP